jgi:hypothetical protein
VQFGLVAAAGLVTILTVMRLWQLDAEPEERTPVGLRRSS